MVNINFKLVTTILDHGLKISKKVKELIIIKIKMIIILVSGKIM